MKGSISLINRIVCLTRHSYDSLSEILNISVPKLQGEDRLNEKDLVALNDFYYFLEEDSTVPRHYTQK